MDARVIGERSDAVLRTAMPAHDVERQVHKFRHRDFLRYSSTRAEALPRGASRRASVQIVGFEPFASPSEGSGAPKFAAADRRDRWSALRRDPSRLRNGIAGP